MAMLPQIEISARDGASAVFDAIGKKADDLGGKVTGMARSFVAAAAAVVSIATIKGKFDDFVAGAAALDDMSERTGIAVEQLSAFASVAKLGGHSVEMMEGSILKLTKGMAGADEETKGAGQALAFLGVQGRDAAGNLRGTDQVILDIAKRFAEFKDGPGKAALAMDLFGKSGAQLLPFLKDLAEQGELVAKVTTEQAAAAEQYEKTLKKLEAAKGALYKQISTALLPVAQDFVTMLLDMKNKSDGVTKAVKDLSADGALTEYFKQGALGAAFLIDAARGIPVVLKMAGAALAGGLVEAINFAEGIAGVAQAVTNLGNGAAQGNGINAAREALARMGQGASMAREDVEKLGAAFTAGSFRTALELQFGKSAQANIERMQQLYGDARDRMAGYTGAITSTSDALNKYVGGTKKAKEETDKFLDKFNALVGKINGKELGVDADFADNLKLLAEGAKKYGWSLEDLAKTESRYITQQKVVQDAEKKREDGIKDLAEALAELLKIQQQHTDAQAQLIGAAADVTRGIEAENAGLRAANEQYGLSTREINALRIAQLQRALATYEAAKATGMLTETDQRAADEIKRQIELLQERDGILAKTETLEAQRTAWQSLTDVTQNFFEDLFQNGTSAFGNLWNVIKRFFAQVAAQFATRFVLQTVLGVGGSLGAASGGGGILGLLGSLFSGGGSLGGVGGFLGGTLGSLGGLMGLGSGSGLLGTLGAGAQLGMTGLMSGTYGSAVGLAGSASPIAGLGAMLPVLIPLAIVAGLAAYFGKDEKGIKFDNSVVGVGNPASHWQQSAISPWDISGDKSPAEFKAFTDKIAYLDQFIADNLLTDSTLEAVRARLQAVKNPDWWNLEDKNAVEKASKYFLQERYGIIFGEIDAEVASMVQTFQGSADELLAFIDQAAQMVNPFKALQAAMPSLNLSLADFLDLTQEQRAAIVQLADTFPLLMVDAFGEVTRIMRESSRGTIGTFRAQADSMLAMAQAFRDGKMSLENFTAAGADMAVAYAQATAKIAEIQGNLNALFGDAREQYTLSGMTPEQQYQYFQNQADKLYADLATATSPEQIESISRRILDYMNRANALLPEADRTGLANDYLSSVDRVEKLANERLAAATTAAQTIAGEVRVAIEAAFDKWTKDQRELNAAAKQNVDDFGANVDRMPRTLDITFTSDVPGRAEVGG